jgi:gluconolactonase
MRYDLATGATTVFRSPSGMTNGMQFDSGGRRVVRTDMKTGKTEWMGTSRAFRSASLTA